MWGSLDIHIIRFTGKTKQKNVAHLWGEYDDELWIMPEKFSISSPL